MVTASQVKELREKTGAGMMDCKKVLTETDGDLEKAAELGNAKAIDIINNKKKTIENHDVKSHNDENEQFTNEYYKEELVKVTKKTAKSLLGFTIDKLEQLKKSL